MRINQREDKFLRTSNLKHYGKKDKAVKPVKIKKSVKIASAVSAVVIAAAILIIPTTTLAPNVDAHEDSKAASMSVGGADQFDAVITNNCKEVTVPPATEPQTTVAPTTAKPEETSKEEKEEKKVKATEAATEPKEEETSEKSDESSESSENETSETSQGSSGYAAGGLGLSSYDRAKVERLVTQPLLTRSFQITDITVQPQASPTQLQRKLFLSSLTRAVQLLTTGSSYSTSDRVTGTKLRHSLPSIAE